MNVAATLGAETRDLPGPLAAGANATGDKNFRHDINALRAIAASAVVLFHFHVAGFRGGFVGVDIFFVISGLLMTQIIDKGIALHNFSILGFYAARVRRIIPALAVLCLVLVVAGSVLPWWLDPLTLGEVARNAAGSMLFVSNMAYANQAGYFADASEANWLLHTWTLSAEWQFYMLYPILLVIAARWHWLWERRFPVIATVCVVGFVGTLFVADRSTHWREVSFFYLPTRAWEMLAGGVIALAPGMSRRTSAVAIAAGVVAIVFAIFGLDDTFPWPSIWTAIPVTGTALMLAGGRYGHFGSPRWAQWPVVQWLGLRSYSLYLWHWPIYVGLTYAGWAMTPIVIAAGVGLSLMAAELSYRFVEVGLRKRLFQRTGTTQRQWAGLAVGYVLCLICVSGVAMSHGLERWRTAQMPANVQAQLKDFREAPDDWVASKPCDKVRSFYSGKICTLGAGNPVRVAVIGDSHAEQMLPRFKQLARSRNIEISVYTRNGCAPLSGVVWTRNGNECNKFSSEAFKAIAIHGYSKVLVHAAWSLYFGNLESHWDKGAVCTPSWLGCRPELDNAIVSERFKKSFEELAVNLRNIRKSGAATYIVLPEPMSFEALPRNYYKELFFNPNYKINPSVNLRDFRQRTDYITHQLKIIAKASGSKTIDPLEYMCGANVCPLLIGRNLAYKDKHHIRASQVFDKIFRYEEEFADK